MKIRNAESNRQDYEVYHELDAKTSYLNEEHIPRFVSMFSLTYEEYCEIVEEEPDWHWILVNDIEQPIGYSQIYINKGVMEIKDFFITKVNRREGNGTQFYYLLEKMAKEEGVTEIRIIVISDLARNFWENVGFEKEFGKRFIKYV